jgi:CheY-like chemotaxis protein
MDYEMDTMDGPMACQKIRRMGSYVFIIGITGNMLPEDVTYFMNCGANCVLAKPLKFDELFSVWTTMNLL